MRNTRKMMKIKIIGWKKIKTFNKKRYIPLILAFLLCFTCIMPFFLAKNKDDKTEDQEKSLKIHNTQDITVITPENKTYTTPMSGYYPATYGFENDKDDTDPKEWLIETETPNALVISELDGHKKLLRLYDDTSGSLQRTRVYNNFSKKDFGTIEVWIQQDDLGHLNDKGQITGMGNDTIIFGVSMWGGTTPTWIVRDNGIEITIIGAPTPLVNTWYHIRIDFEHTTGGYQGLSKNEYYAYIDGSQYGPYHFDVDEQLEELHLHTYSYGIDYNVYFDAVGYSWDPYYNIGDNLNEGMLLSFENNTDLEWIGYSLDNQANRTILGNTTLSMPDYGIHTIQIFGNDSWGSTYQSNVRYFYVSPFEIISPENITYTAPMSGYYPATYGFENDIEGHDPEDWVIEEEEAGDIEVVEEEFGHKKVLKIPDSNGSRSILYQPFEISKTKGTVEFWILIEDATERITIQIGDENAGDVWQHSCALWFGRDNRIEIYNGSDLIEVYSNLNPNEWYHLKIEFDCTDDWHFWVNGDQLDLGGYTLRGTPLSMTQFRIGSQTNPTPVAYLDAVGYSWDPNYNIGDNLYEGLLLSFENKTNLDWMGYSLNNQATKKVLGNSSIPIPRNGTHTIQVFGNNLLGTQYHSEIRHFAIDYPIEIITPESKIYSEAMKGYYPATYGFEDVENGFDHPDWTDGQETSQIIASLGGHNKIYQCGGNILSCHQQWDSSQNYGTVEIYINDEDAYYGFQVAILELGVGTAFSIRTREDKFQYYNGTWNDIGKPALDNTWYHIRIDFETTTGGYMGLSDWTWRAFVDGQEFGSFEFANNYLPNTLQAYGESTSSDRSWDAVGYSWDPYYNIGDNLNEGLLLSYENNTVLEWIGYSLDGQANRTILGNITFPLPKDGPHTIKIFGNDSLGTIFHSNIKHFLVDTISPEITIISPSQNEFFGNITPGFEISYRELNLHSTWYSLDGGTNITFTGLTGSIDQTEWGKKGNGTVIIRFYINDTGGLMGHAEVPIRKDTYAPTSLITFIPHSGTDVVNESTEFSLTADDGLGSGVSFIRYRINDSSWITFSTPFTLVNYPYGDTLISYQAVDQVDNYEPIQTLLVHRTDTIAPTSSISFTPYQVPNTVIRSTSFTITADDGLGSGISLIRYKIDDSAWFDYLGPFNLSSYQDGDHTITYQAIDVVGNIEVERTIMITLKSEPGDTTWIIIIIIGSSAGIAAVSVITVILVRKRRKK